MLAKIIRIIYNNYRKVVKVFDSLKKYVRLLVCKKPTKNKEMQRFYKSVGLLIKHISK